MYSPVLFLELHCVLACQEGQGSPWPCCPSSRPRANSFTCIIRGSRSRWTKSAAPDRDARGNQSRRPNPTCGNQPNRPYLEVFSRDPRGVPRTQQQGREGARPPAQIRGGSHSESAPATATSQGAARPLDQPSSGSLHQERLRRLAARPAGSPAHLSSLRRPQAGEDVHQGRGRLSEGGFSADPGRWFRW